MDNTAKSLICLLSLAVLIAIVDGAATPSTPKAVLGKDGAMRIYRLEIENEQDVSKLNFPNHEEVILNSPRISVLSVQMLLQLRSVKTFWIQNGTVPVAHVTPQIRKMVIRNCSTSDVIIDPRGEYEMKHFTLIYGELKALPPNLNSMKKLEKLSLNENKIEYVNLADLAGLKNLKELSLLRNKIFQIHAPALQIADFPNLEKLNAGSNRLTGIDFERWNAPSLRVVYLQRNQLAAVLSLPGALPALVEVSLYENPLSCEWYNLAKRELKVRKVKILNKDQTVCEESDEALDDLVTKTRLQDTFVTIQLMNHMNSEMMTSSKIGSVELQGKVSDSMGKVKLLENQQRILQLSMNNSVISIQNLQSRNDILGKALEILKSKNDYLSTALKTTSEDISKEVQQLRTDNAVLQVRDKSFEKSIDLLQKNTVELQKDDKRLEKAILALRSDNQAIKADIQKRLNVTNGNFSAEIRQLKQESATFMMKDKALEQMLESLQKGAADLQKGEKRFEKSLEVLRSENVWLKEKLNDTVANVTGELSELWEQSDGLQNLWQTSLAKLQNDSVELRKEDKRLAKSLELIQESNEATKKEVYTQLTKAGVNFSAMVQQLRKESEDSQDVVRKSLERLEKENAELRGLENSLMKIQNENEQLRTSMQNHLSAATGNVSTDIMQLFEETGFMKTQIKETTDKADNLMISLTMLGSETTEVRNENAKLVKNLAKLQEENEATKTNMQSLLNITTDHFSAIMQQLQMESEGLQNSLQESLEKLQTDNMDLQNANEGLGKTILQLQTENKESQNNLHMLLNVTTENFSVAFQQLHEENEGLEKSLAILQDQNLDLKRWNENLEKSVKQLQRENDAMRNSMQQLQMQTAQQMTKTATQSNNQAAVLTDKLVDQLRKENAALEAKLKQSNEKSAEEIAQLHKRMDEFLKANMVAGIAASMMDGGMNAMMNSVAMNAAASPEMNVKEVDSAAKTVEESSTKGVSVEAGTEAAQTGETAEKKA
ncbi:conserved hypothetical protein [Culex quinquefasciatus]|uniref:Uncharacterized protein n=1 Tax=Culex quinquefasciatus TaxID=7176 RepID=B0X1L8_CULQU|nr:conserved hypothetical protein [Culex quinquefasciatus]|eukprot:XP_001863541.1 conserved hypothetical protein [Culex quinquefasciatus]